MRGHHWLRAAATSPRRRDSRNRARPDRRSGAARRAAHGVRVNGLSSAACARLGPMAETKWSKRPANASVADVKIHARGADSRDGESPGDRERRFVVTPDWCTRPTGSTAFRRAFAGGGSGGRRAGVAVGLSASLQALGELLRAGEGARGRGCARPPRRARQREPPTRSADGRAAPHGCAASRVELSWAACQPEHRKFLLDRRRGLRPVGGVAASVGDAQQVARNRQLPGRHAAPEELRRDLGIGALRRDQRVGARSSSAMPSSRSRSAQNRWWLTTTTSARCAAWRARTEEMVRSGQSCSGSSRVEVARPRRRVLGDAGARCGRRSPRSRRRLDPPQYRDVLAPFESPSSRLRRRWWRHT